MTDKHAQDIFDFSALDKVQEDIEAEINSDAPTSDFLSIDEDWQVLLEEADPLHTTKPFEWSDAPDITGGFYRETIKNTTQQSHGYGKWFKRAMAIVLACTLGAGSLGFGIGAGFGVLRSNSTEEQETTGDNTITSIGYTFENVQDEMEAGTLADIVELLKPSVVGITSRGGTQQERQGSGLIFAENDERIFIVTNFYVVQDGGNRFDISINGSDPLIGRPAGSDTSAHLAVLSIEKTSLVTAGIDRVVIATFGDSDKMRVGDTVLAIGNAMGYGTAVTRGVISANEQSIIQPINGHRLSLLQTDAAINYGNSGGPLINTRGEVIGINFDRAPQMVFGRPSAEGIGFSISSNVVAPLLDDVVQGRRPALGIVGGTISEANAERMGIPSIGVLVSAVSPGRAAELGGVIAGDVITSFNGQQVFNWANLQDGIRAARIGDTVQIRVLRVQGREREALTLYVELDAFVVDNF